MKLEKISTSVLFEELKRRGYHTESIWGIGDVREKLENLIGDEELPEGTEITDREAMEILEIAIGEADCSDGFDRIESGIHNLIEDRKQAAL